MYHSLRTPLCSHGNVTMATLRKRKRNFLASQDDGKKKKKSTPEYIFKKKRKKDVTIAGFHYVCIVSFFLVSLLFCVPCACICVCMCVYPHNAIKLHRVYVRVRVLYEYEYCTSSFCDVLCSFIFYDTALVRERGVRYWWFCRGQRCAATVDNLSNPTSNPTTFNSRG